MGVVSDDAGFIRSSSTRAPLTERISINLSAVFAAFPSSGFDAVSSLVLGRKPGWPTARRSRRRVPSRRPRCSTGCSWTTTWKQTARTSTPPQKPATCLSQWTTRRSTSPPWRPTSPTGSPPRSDIGWCHVITHLPGFLWTIGAVLNFYVMGL